MFFVLNAALWGRIKNRHMKVHLQRKNEAVHFEASSELSAVSVNIDGSESIGGEGKGVRPMELVLMALGSCSVFDLTTILKKQRQEEHTSELRHVKISYAVFCMKKKIYISY